MCRAEGGGAEMRRRKCNSTKTQAEGYVDSTQKHKSGFRHTPVVRGSHLDHPLQEPHPACYIPRQSTTGFGGCFNAILQWMRGWSLSTACHHASLSIASNVPVAYGVIQVSQFWVSSGRLGVHTSGHICPITSVHVNCVNIDVTLSCDVKSALWTGCIDWMFSIKGELLCFSIFSHL